MWFCAGWQAYFGMHTPQDTEDAEQGRQRLVFDEFFYLQVLNYSAQMTETWWSNLFQHV